MMDAATERLTEGLKKAILAEYEGHHFYRMAASTTPDEKGRETFEMLAREEMEHVRFLRAQYKSFLETGKADETEKLGPRTDLIGGSPIFSSEIKSRVTEAHFEMTALSVGAQLEIGAVKFYQGEADASDDETVKRFYTELAEWEQGHYDALTRQLEELRGDYWSAGGFSPF
jgi:rubrerythrin